MANPVYINPDSIGSAKDFAKGAERVRNPAGKKLNLGGVTVPSMVSCPDCGEGLTIGVGYALRTGPSQAPYCHVIFNPDIADPVQNIVKRGGRQ